jgi:hypothetical protein
VVKSNPSAMTKRRKVQVDPELLKELEDLERRMRETDRKIDADLAMADETLRLLREDWVVHRRR